MTNIDKKTVASFGDEWTRYNQAHLSSSELKISFEKYFGIFPWEKLPVDATGFDMGCGSGRWASLVAPRVAHLYCIDPSAEALDVAKRALARMNNVDFINAPAGQVPLPPSSQDFGYSLGVLHHIPNTAAALAGCTALLKPGAPFLLYLYYRFDNRPRWFRAMWKCSETIRALVSGMPGPAKSFATDILAALVYWPLARLSLVLERIGINPSFMPLSFYRNSSFYTMRTDSRDRFGTPLEQRFTRSEIEQMMRDAGLEDIRFSEIEPYWVAVGTKIG